MSLSSHALYDGNQVNATLVHNQFKLFLKQVSPLVWSFLKQKISLPESIYFFLRFFGHCREGTWGRHLRRRYSPTSAWSSYLRQRETPKWSAKPELIATNDNASMTLDTCRTCKQFYLALFQTSKWNTNTEILATGLTVRTFTGFYISDCIYESPVTSVYGLLIQT